jgi:hypothetical protein
MRKLQISDWALFVLAAPIGGSVGAIMLYLGTAACLSLVGRGSSHTDAFDLFFMAVSGGFCGFVAGPMVVWRRWRRQSPF